MEAEAELEIIGTPEKLEKVPVSNARYATFELVQASTEFVFAVGLLSHLSSLKLHMWNL